MNLKKLSGFKLPVAPKALLDAIGLTDQQSSQNMTISLMVDVSLEAGLMDYAKAALKPQTGNITVEVKPYFNEAVPFGAGSDVALILANSAPATGKLMVQALREQIPAVVVTLDGNKVQLLSKENYNELDPTDIVCAFSDGDVEPYKQLFYELASWMVRRLSDKKATLSRGFAFMREPFIDDAIIATSIQNTAIAAVFFLPGADMPLLTLNQIKMFLQIAAAYGADISAQRLKELAIILVGGFGFRAIARKLVGLVPMFGWAMRGGVGFGATYAIGKAAKAYFEAGGDMVEIAKSLAPTKQQAKKADQLQADRQSN